MKRNVSFVLLFLLSAVPLSAQEVRQAAIMVHRPSNRLAWNHLGREAAFMLSCDEVLRHYVGRTDGLRLAGAHRVNGIYSGMKAGLYFPRGDGLYAKWQPFLEADIYVECDWNRTRLIWRGGTAAAEKSKTVNAPYNNPKACAAALVELVFELAGKELDPAWKEELADPETKRPELWFEWAQWIGYRPHWLHHAPWSGPHKSAQNILEQDPNFTRGAAWGLQMLMRKEKGQKRSPASPRYLPVAYRVLASPFHYGARPFLQQQLNDPRVRREAVLSLGLPQLELAIGLDVGGDDDKEKLAPGAGKASGEPQMPTDAVFRSRLIELLGAGKSKMAAKALPVVLTDAEDPALRVAAALALSSYPPQAGVLRQALVGDADGTVRAAALRALTAMKKITPADIAAARKGPGPVRLQLVETVTTAQVKPDARAAVLKGLLPAKDPELRAAALGALDQHTEVAVTDVTVAPVVKEVLNAGSDAERLAALRWIRRQQSTAHGDAVKGLLQAETPRLQAAAAATLAVIAPAQVDAVVKILLPKDAPLLQRTLAQIIAAGKEPAKHRDTVFALLAKSHVSIRQDICLAAYEVLGRDRKALARAMRYDPDLPVNLAGFRLLRRLGDAALAQEVLGWCATQHPNEYVRARALREYERMKLPQVSRVAANALQAPYWVVRLEAADVLSRTATTEELAAIQRARTQTKDEWLGLALADAECKAQGKPLPERVRLGLGKTRHTEGGDTPNGFQVWLGNFPKDKKEARRLVDEGYRLGVKNKEPNMPGGTVLTAYNSNRGMRNTYLLQSILEPLKKWQSRLPYTYYVALFDEPCTLGGVRGNTAHVRGMLLEAGRPDLLPLTRQHGGEALLAALPPEFQRAYPYYNARMGGEASNWVVHMYRLTAQRRYPDLRIFPQSLSYMRKLTHDAFDMIDADGDYTWRYHYHNFMRDGTIGAVNRVLNPGKPLCMITWMSWHRPNVINGNTLYIDTNYPMQPWRYRNYMGTRSALALWATGTEAGFFDHIGLGVTSNKDARGQATRAFQLKPWSKTAHAAVTFLLSDKGYWKQVEGKIALKIMRQKRKTTDDTPDILGDDDDLGDELGGDLLDDGPTPLEKEMKATRDKLYDKLMTGISYMNIFNTDATRALSNLPKPDTRPRSTLVIVGRDAYWWGDSGQMLIPALALADGFDLVPNYDAVGKADLMRYDTILLRASGDGVTDELVAKINDWLRRKDKGLLIVSGPCQSRKRLFPMLRVKPGDEAFLWEKDVQFKSRARVKETYRDRRRREKTRMVWPKINRLQPAAGAAIKDPESRIWCSTSGAVTPLITGSDKDLLLARWRAPAAVKSIVLFDGCGGAGPVYTAALETAVLAIDKERGSPVKRNRWWGHTIYENEQFVVDVATNGLSSLHEARPRQHRGVDIITGVINPVVKHGECALVLKDYVGPYAGAKGDWAVMARQELREMKLLSPTKLRIDAVGVVRVSHIGVGAIRLSSTKGFEKVENQVLVWKAMREKKQAYSVNDVKGGKELHYFSLRPVTVVVE